MKIKKALSVFMATFIFATAIPAFASAAEPAKEVAPEAKTTSSDVINELKAEGYDSDEIAQASDFFKTNKLTGDQYQFILDGAKQVYKDANNTNLNNLDKMTEDQVRKVRNDLSSFYYEKKLPFNVLGIRDKDNDNFTVEVIQYDGKKWNTIATYERADYSKKEATEAPTTKEDSKTTTPAATTATKAPAIAAKTATKAAAKATKKVANPKTGETNALPAIMVSLVAAFAVTGGLKLKEVVNK